MPDSSCSGPGCYPTHYWRSGSSLAFAIRDKPPGKERCFLDGVYWRGRIEAGHPLHSSDRLSDSELMQGNTINNHIRYKKGETTLHKCFGT